jgi:O-antigen/teichoic acid export membrane protein
MSLAHKIAKNTLFQAFGKILSSLCSLAAIALVTRYLGPALFGEYSTSIAFLQIFGILVDLGLTLVTVQMISEKGADIKKTLDNIFSFRILSAFCFMALAPLAVIFFPYPGIVKIGVLVGAGAFFFNAVNQVLIGLFQKELKMERVAIAEIANRLVFLALTGIAILFNFNLIAFLVAMATGNFINFIILYLFAQKIVKINFNFDFTVWKEIFRRSWPIAAGIALNLIYLRADIFILSLYKPAQDVGFYSASYKVIDFLTAFPYMLLGLVLPVLTLAWSEKNSEYFKEISQKTFDFLNILALPMVAGGIILAKPLMIFFAGQEFAESSEILQILLLALGMIFPATIFTHAIIAIGKQKSMLWGFGASAILTLAGYIVFIPKFSYFGAAWMTVFSEGLILIWSAAMVYKYSKFLPKLKLFIRSLSASIVMAWILWMLGIQNIILAIPIGALIYFALLFAVKGINLKMIREVISLK